MTPICFSTDSLFAVLQEQDEVQRDALAFGVIGFDAEGIVQSYNAVESRMTGLSRATVVGSDLFKVVAPCMNNFMVAQRFVDTIDNGLSLDAIIDYVLTFRMRPTQVQLRMMSEPGAPLRFLAIQRRT
jgi:photoactive yellow protein